MKESISISLESECLNRLNELSEDRFISRSALISILIADYYKNNKEEVKRK